MRVGGWQGINHHHNDNKRAKRRDYNAEIDAQNSRWRSHLNSELDFLTHVKNDCWKKRCIVYTDGGLTGPTYSSTLDVNPDGIQK